MKSSGRQKERAGSQLRGQALRPVALGHGLQMSAGGAEHGLLPFWGQ